LQKEIDRSNRYNSPLSAILLDIDFFKTINDTHGHLAGDLILVELAKTLAGSTRKSDLVARTGGEEFLILMPETRLRGCIHKAKALQKEIAALKVPFNNHELSCTVSMGCAEFKRRESLEEYYSHLDKLLYSSKDAGRNRITTEDGTL
jgi:diguanylate cyclase (GGDEF)-like protein